MLLQCGEQHAPLCAVPTPRYVIVVEHDLSVLDYLSDYICCLYGVPGAYGVVTMPFSVREGVCVHECVRETVPYGSLFRPIQASTFSWTGLCRLRT